MANGATASVTLTFTGASPASFGQEVDLTIDAGGDLLTVDAAGDALIVSPGVSWTGTTASFVWPPANTIVTEGGQDILTETGGTIATEGVMKSRDPIIGGLVWAALVVVWAWLCLASPARGQTRISVMPAAAALAGPELLPIVQGGANVVTTPSALLAYIQGAIDVPATQITGNLAVARLNGGTGASSSTYWRGDGTWATPSGGGPGAYSATKPANPANTTSTSPVMAGLGSTSTITPATTGRALITVSGDIYCSTAAAVVNAALYISGVAGQAAPTNGAAEASVTTPTALGAAISTVPGSSGATHTVPFSITYVATGLTVGSAYWIDLAFDTGTAADAANLANLSVTAVEF